MALEKFTNSRLDSESDDDDLWDFTAPLKSSLPKIANKDKVGCEDEDDEMDSKEKKKSDKSAPSSQEAKSVPPSATKTKKAGKGRKGSKTETTKEKVEPASQTTGWESDSDYEELFGTQRCGDFSKDSFVLTMWSGNGLWYPAQVVSYNFKNDTYSLLYYDSTRASNVPRNRIKSPEVDIDWYIVEVRLLMWNFLF